MTFFFFYILVNDAIVFGDAPFCINAYKANSFSIYVKIVEDIAIVREYFGFLLSKFV